MLRLSVICLNGSEHTGTGNFSLLGPAVCPVCPCVWKQAVSQNQTGDAYTTLTSFLRSDPAPPLFAHSPRHLPNVSIHNSRVFIRLPLIPVVPRPDASACLASTNRKLLNRLSRISPDFSSTHLNIDHIWTFKNRRTSFYFLLLAHLFSAAIISCHLIPDPVPII